MRPSRRLLVAVALALAVTSCSGGGDDDAHDKDTETSSEAHVKATVALDVTRAELVSPHQALGPLDGGTRDAVAGVVEKLLLVTSADPLADGKVGPGFADLFTPDAGARAANADRHVVFDESVPRFGDLKPTTATLELTGLAGYDDPKTQLVIAKFAWDVASAERPGDHVSRRGELSLVPGGDGWKVGAYTIVVTRTVDDKTTTTTATTR